MDEEELEADVVFPVVFARIAKDLEAEHLFPVPSTMIWEKSFKLEVCFLLLEGLRIKRLQAEMLFSKVLE